MQYKRLGFTLFKFLSPTVHITTQFKLLKDNGYLINGEVILCFQFSYHYHLPHFLSLHSWFLIPFFVQFSSYRPLSPLVLIVCVRLCHFFLLFIFFATFFSFFCGSCILLWMWGLPSERGGAASLLRLPQALLNI